MNAEKNRITLSERVIIEAGIYARKTFKKIANEIRKHPSTVSREIKNNRTLLRGERYQGKDCRYAPACKKKGVCGDIGCNKRCVFCREVDCRKVCSRYDNRTCPKLDKPPYVCNTCGGRRRCRADRAYYSAPQANALAMRRYSEGHMGIRTRGQQFEQLDKIVSKLIKQGQPLTHIHAEHGEMLGVTERTLYNYIGAGELSIGNLDLRRKVGYRPRKKKREPSEKFVSLDFRKNRSYGDFVQYMTNHPNSSIVEMDTIQGVREKGKCLLTMLFIKNRLMLMFLMRDRKSDSVTEVFDYLTSLIGLKAFRKLFPAIITDNGSEFKRVHEIEYTVDGEKRTRIFYCDPLASWQKPHIEKNHAYVRYVIPKRTSLNPYTQDDMTLLANHINSTRRAGLDFASPYELVDDPDMKTLMKLLGLELIPSDEVSLKPALLINHN